jgi:hypothetical protein
MVAKLFVFDVRFERYLPPIAVCWTVGSEDYEDSSQNKATVVCDIPTLLKETLISQ